MESNTPTFHSVSGSELLRTLLKHRWPILYGTVAVAVVSVVISLLLPNQYRSSANLMPANTPAIGLDMLSRGGGLSNLTSSILRSRSSAFDRFLVLLETHAVKKQVIEKFNLMEVYDTKGNTYPMIDTIKELDANTNFETFEEGNMLIEVWDEDPARAKEMTEYYVSLINEYNIELSTTEATRFREYIEAKYKDTMGKVDSLQAQTVAFQKKYGVIEFTAQATEYMSAISMTTALLMESEIKLKMIAENAKETNPLYQRQLKEVNHLKTTLEEMYANTNPNDIILNFADMPEVSTQYVRLLAEAEILQEMLKYLVPIYENAKMEEVKAIPGLVVVDAPYLAEKKDKPKRMLIVVAATLSGFLLMMIYIALRELMRRNQAYLISIRS